MKGLYKKEDKMLKKSNVLSQNSNEQGESKLENPSDIVEENAIRNDDEKDTLLASEKEVEDIEIELPESYGKDEVDAIKAYAKSLKLTKEQALALSKLSKKLEENSRLKQEEQKQNWEDELEKDKEVGGKNFLKNIEYAKIALQKFDTNNELKTLLNESGYGSHPIVVKFFINLGKKLNEDSFIHGQNAKKNKPLYERLYK